MPQSRSASSVQSPRIFTVRNTQCHNVLGPYILYFSHSPASVKARLLLAILILWTDKCGAIKDFKIPSAAPTKYLSLFEEPLTCTTTRRQMYVDLVHCLCTTFNMCRTIKAELSIVIDFMMLLFHYRWALNLRKPFVDEKKHGSIWKQKLIYKLLIC